MLNISGWPVCYPHGEENGRCVKLMTHYSLHKWWNTRNKIQDRLKNLVKSHCMQPMCSVVLFVVWEETGQQRKSKEEVTELYMRNVAIMLQQHPHFLLTVISALLSHPTLAWARQSHQALRLLRIRRERGRQEGHLRGIDAWDIRALLTERWGGGGRQGDGREEKRGSRKGKINISLDLVVLIS